MYKSNRARLGSSLTLSPYESQKRWISEHLVMFFLGVCCCFLFIGFIYLLCAMILFFGGHYYMNLWEDGQETVTSIYARPWMELIRWIGCILILIFTVRRAAKKPKKT